MNNNIVSITEGDDEFIEDKLVEYNLSMVPATQDGMYWQSTLYGLMCSIADKGWGPSCLVKLNVRQWRKAVISCIWIPSIFRQRSFMKKMATLCSAHLRIVRRDMSDIL